MTRSTRLRLTAGRHLALAMTASLPAMLAGTGAFAQAAPAVTPEGARQLTQALATYLSQAAVDSGVLAVEPQGQDYKITIAPQKAIDAIKSPDHTASVDPVTVLVRPSADGTWAVSTKSFPGFSYSSKGPDGVSTMKVEPVPYDFQCQYDTRIAACLTGTGTIGKLSMTSSSPISNGVASYSGGMFKTESKPAGTDAVTTTMTEQLRDLDETVSLHGTGSTPPMDIRFQTGPIDATLQSDAMKGRGLLDLEALLLRHATAGTMVQGQAEVKAALTALLPLWDNLSGSTTLHDVKVTTPFGAGSASSLSETVGFTGLSKNGGMTFKLGFDGLALPTALMPGWVVPLLPGSADINLKVAGLDLDALSREAITSADAANPDIFPADAQGRLMAILASTVTTVTIDPSRITAPGLDLAMSGALTIAGMKPTGTVRLEAKHFEEAVSTLQSAAATNPDVQQAMLVLVAAKGLAHTLPDGRTEWVVEAKQDGSISVNNTMVKPAD